MASPVLFTIIVIAVLLVVVALVVWRRQKEEKLAGISGKQKKASFAQWITGVVLALAAAIFTFDGHILGEDTAGISTVLGIVGISLIASSNVNLLLLRRN